MSQATLQARQCSERGCVSMAEPGGRCQHHLMKHRRKLGLCANCGGDRVREPEMNSLTGTQLRRRGELAWLWRCLGCGRVQRYGG